TCGSNCVRSSDSAVSATWRSVPPKPNSRAINRIGQRREDAMLYIHVISVMVLSVIPFLDLTAQYHGIKDEIDRAIADVLESGQFVLGSPVAAFEEEFAGYCGGGQAIGVNSGASALHLALLAAGAGPGDEAITTPFTFAATVAAIHYTGAMPVFVDIDPVTYNLDPMRLEAAITARTKAIVPVHLYGHPAEMDPILDIAWRHGLVVIEDAAQAHGAEYKGRRAGALGDMAC